MTFCNHATDLKDPIFWEPEMIEQGKRCSSFLYFNQSRVSKPKRPIEHRRKFPSSHGGQGPRGGSLGVWGTREGLDAFGS